MQNRLTSVYGGKILLWRKRATGANKIRRAALFFHLFFIFSSKTHQKLTRMWTKHDAKHLLSIFHCVYCIHSIFISFIIWMKIQLLYFYYFPIFSWQKPTPNFFSRSDDNFLEFVRNAWDDRDGKRCNKVKTIYSPFTHWDRPPPFHIIHSFFLLSSFHFSFNFFLRLENTLVMLTWKIFNRTNKYKNFYNLIHSISTIRPASWYFNRWAFAGKTAKYLAYSSLYPPILSPLSSLSILFHASWRNFLLKLFLELELFE